MNVHKRYKMYKKGKKWCCMALTTFVAILGVLTTTEIANADIVTDPDQVALVSSTKTTIANENSSSADLNTTSNVEAVSMTSLPASTIKNGLETENTNTYYYENGQQDR